MRMRDLADAVVLSRSGLTRLVDRLQREGLIDREQCASDARGAYAVLTETGRARLREAQPLHRESVRQRFLSRSATTSCASWRCFWERLTDVLIDRTGPGPSRPSTSRWQPRGRADRRGPRPRCP